MNFCREVIIVYPFIMSLGQLYPSQGCAIRKGNNVVPSYQGQDGLFGELNPNQLISLIPQLITP